MEKDAAKAAQQAAREKREAMRGTGFVHLGEAGPHVYMATDWEISNIKDFCNGERFIFSIQVHAESPFEAVKAAAKEFDGAMFEEARVKPL